MTCEEKIKTSQACLSNMASTIKTSQACQTWRQ